MASAAIIGAAVIGAVGSGMAASKNASAAKKAANAQVEAAQGTNALDLSIYNDQRNLLEPSITAGAAARARQMLMMGYPPSEVKAFLQQMQAAVNSPGPTLDDGRSTPMSRYLATRGISGGTGGVIGQMVTSPTTTVPGQPGETEYSELSLTNLGGYQGGAAEQAYRNGNAEVPFSGAELADLMSEAEGGGAAASGQQSGVDDFAWVDDWEWQPNSPSYQFRFDQGAEALNRNLSARGLFSSGAAAKRLTEYGQDFGSQEFEADFRRLGGFAGDGADSTGTVVNVGGELGRSLGENMRYAGDARATGYRQAGAAQAAGIQGATNSITGALGAYGSYNGWWG